MHLAGSQNVSSKKREQTTFVIHIYIYTCLAAHFRFPSQNLLVDVEKHPASFLTPARTSQEPYFRFVEYYDFSALLACSSRSNPYQIRHFGVEAPGNHGSDRPLPPPLPSTRWATVAHFRTRGQFRAQRNERRACGERAARRNGRRPQGQRKPKAWRAITNGDGHGRERSNTIKHNRVGIIQ